jgi:hypothetical protein
MEPRPCPRCGTSNPPDASTCSWCGRAIVDDGDPTEPLDRPVARPPAGEPGEPGAPPQPPAGSRQDLEDDWGQPTRPWPPQEAPWGAPAGSQPAGQAPEGGSWGQGGSAYGGGYGAAGGPPGWAPQGGEPGQAGWGAGAPPARRGRGPLLLAAVAGVLLVVALAAVAFRLVSSRSNANEPLVAPASVGGFSRIERGIVRSQLDMNERQLRQRGAKNFVVAAYGTEVQPRFILVAVRDANDRARHDVIEGFDTALARQPGSQGGDGDQTFRRDDVDYRCTSSQLGATVAICRFDDGDIVGFGFSPGVTPQRVSELTAEARNQMTD